MGGGASTLGTGAGASGGRQAATSEPTRRFRDRLHCRSDRLAPPSSSAFDSSRLGFLSDEVILEILAFVGDGPLEQTSARASLTHVLPFVCRRFRRLIYSSDVIWSAALRRSFRSYPHAWGEGAASLVAASAPSCARGFGDLSRSPPWALGGTDSPLWKFRVQFQGRNPALLGEEELARYVSLLCQIVGHRRRDKNLDGNLDLGDEMGTKAAADGADVRAEISLPKRTYMFLSRERIPRKLPLLHLPAPAPKIRQTLRLDAFDPRHVPLVKELTKDRSRRERSGAVPLAAPRPEFILAPRGAEPHDGTNALLVELRYCRLHSFRRGYFEVRPTRRVHVIQIHERDSEEGLVDALFRPRNSTHEY